MSSVNLKIIVGHIGNLEIKQTKDGSGTWVRFSVATEDYAGKDKKVTTWHQCKAFGKTAELTGRLATKGTLVYVQGPERIDKVGEGQKGYYPYTIVDRVQFLAKLRERGEDAAGPPRLVDDSEDGFPPDLDEPPPF